MAGKGRLSGGYGTLVLIGQPHGASKGSFLIADELDTFGRGKSLGMICKSFSAASDK